MTTRISAWPLGFKLLFGITPEWRICTSVYFKQIKCGMFTALITCQTQSFVDNTLTLPNDTKHITVNVVLVLIDSHRYEWMT